VAPLSFHGYLVSTLASLTEALLLGTNGTVVDEVDERRQPNGDQLLGVDPSWDTVEVNDPIVE
jgi:hypothetical protein